MGSMPTTMQTNGYFPEECDTTGADCPECVRRTADAMRALTANPTAEWASGVFQRMYSHPACGQMEHSFVWACGVAPVASPLVHIAVAA